MDPAASLLQLLSSSTEQLQSLYQEIGDPNYTYQSAVEELHRTLTTTIQSCLKSVQDRRHELVEDCRAKNAEAAALREALGDNAPLDDAASKSTALQAQQQRLHQQISNLRSVHAARQAQADLLLSQLDEHRQVLGDAVAIPSAPDGTATTFRSLPLAYIASLEQEAKRGELEVEKRTAALQEQLQTVLNLWSALHLTPEVGQDSLDAEIMTHLQVRPIWHVGPETGGQAQFFGEFEHFKNVRGETEVFSAPETVEPTPTRKSTGNRSSNGADDAQPQCLQIRDRKPIASRILPTSLNIERVARKLASLESEKASREEKIQQLYDELSEIWMQFDVPQDEMETFVHTNSGSTLEAIEAYRRELQKMQDLRREHMALFIEKLRERIRRLWDTLRMSEEERREEYPECFAETDGGSEEALAAHEETIVRLSHEVQTKEPVLQLIARLQDLLDEEKQMEEDAKDPNRFKNTRGDPGRLLREEKTRKRIKVQKPKITAELLKVVPAWEEEHGKEFTIDGVPYLATLQEAQAGAAARDPRKRNRTVSTASTASDGSALAHSNAHNRVAATPMRVPATPASGSLAKKPRLAQPPPSSARSAISAMPPPASNARPAGSRIAKAVPSNQLRPPGAQPTATAVRARPASGFRPRPSSVLQSYISSGGGRRSADSLELNAPGPSSRTASQSSSGTVVIHDVHSMHGSLSGDPTIRSVRVGSRAALAPGPNWMAVQEEES